MKPRTYDTPAAFKRALEDRLKAASTSGVDFARRRQLLVFDRFLARMAVAFGDAVMLKGGLVLELRLERARTTKDVDLRLAGSGKDILDRLRDAGALVLGDFMQFEVAPDPDTPEIVGDGVQYDGYRFRAECRLAAKVYGARFGVDIAFGGVLSGDVEEITTDDLLGFAGIAPPRLRVVPIETHLAEKLHAYTMPRARPNTRVKDLPDLALLGTIRPLELAEALGRTLYLAHLAAVLFWLLDRTEGRRATGELVELAERLLGPIALALRFRRARAALLHADALIRPCAG